MPTSCYSGCHTWPAWSWVLSRRWTHGCAKHLRITLGCSSASPAATRRARAAPATPATARKRSGAAARSEQRVGGGRAARRCSVHPVLQACKLCNLLLKDAVCVGWRGQPPNIAWAAATAGRRRRRQTLTLHRAVNCDRPAPLSGTRVLRNGRTSVTPSAAGFGRRPSGLRQRPGHV